MKAAVIFEQGASPQYSDVADPRVQHPGEVLISVRAAAIKHFDKKRAGGDHYSSGPQQMNPIVIGGDGVGQLEDGTRIFALGEGMIAENAVIDETRIVRLPDLLDDAIAAALPNAVAGSAMALRFRAGIRPGETVLINGATGFTGKIAVQLAKYYGAKKVIVTGRNEKTLTELLSLGADEIISVLQDDDSFVAQLKKTQALQPVDIVIDYLWGHTAELIFSSLRGNGSMTHPVRYVSIGAVTGDRIQLSAEVLRSVDLHISGSGLGSWKKEEIGRLFSEILPEMFELAAAKKLKVDVERVDLADIGSLWNMQVPDGKRLVVMM